MSEKSSFNIPLSEPVISGNEKKYVNECLDTGWVSSVGSYVERFEQMAAAHVGSDHAVAVVNGTSAIHVSLLCCDVKPGDEVIVPALTFIASVNAIKYCVGEPVFMDCKAETLCMDADKVGRFLESKCELRSDGFTYNKQSGRRVKALIVVHVFGHPADMDALVNICNQWNLTLIEDATESLGSEFKGKQTGSFGTVGCFSFNGNKILTTGGGGMVVTSDKSLSERIKHITTQAKCSRLEYDHDEIGYNYRLTNIQAAIGVGQMERLAEFIEIKRSNASLYNDLLSGIAEIQFIWEPDGAKSNFWFYTIKVPRDHKNHLIDFLLSKNIGVRPVWKLVNTLPMYRNCESYEVEQAIDVYDRCINLPCSVTLKEENIKFIVEKINDYFLSKGQKGEDIIFGKK